MDLKTVICVCLFALLSIHLTVAAPAGNESYTCLEPTECADDSIYAVVGNLTLCCYDGDAITFSAKTHEAYVAQRYFIHFENSTETLNKRSTDGTEVNSTITYSCFCTPVDASKYDMEGNFAVLTRYIWKQLDDAREVVKRIVRKFVF